MLISGRRTDQVQRLQRPLMLFGSERTMISACKAMCLSKWSEGTKEILDNDLFMETASPLMASTLVIDGSVIILVVAMLHCYSFLNIIVLCLERVDLIELISTANSGEVVLVNNFNVPCVKVIGASIAHFRKQSKRGARG
jgi:hypothetical protein